LPVASESEPGSDLEVKVLWEPWWWESLAEQQLRRREAWWEGSCRQTAGPTNRNCIQGEREVGEWAERPEARYHSGRARVDAAVDGRKVTRLTLGDLRVCPRGYARREACGRTRRSQPTP
jgi:hypothetical protein